MRNSPMREASAFWRTSKHKAWHRELLSAELPSEIRYPVERSLELHGTVYDLDNRLLTNTKIQMMASSDSDLVIRELETDAAGVLHVKDIDVTGETNLFSGPRVKNRPAVGKVTAY